MFFKKLDTMRDERPVLWYVLSIIRALIIGLIAMVAAVAVFLAVATALDYRPADLEEVAVEGETGAVPAMMNEFTLATWNIGYAGLGDDADFFMDGGSHVRAETQERVEKNLKAIIQEVNNIDADVTFLQEIDMDSSRTYHINEGEQIRDAFPNQQYSFAYNYKAFFIPYPMPMLGKVHAGIATLSKTAVSGAERVALPVSFKWPVSTLNLKRCLLVSRMQLPGTEKELVLINLHLEAYDDGEGKIAQTKVLREYMDAELAKGNYVIAGGDFNQRFSTVDPALYPLQVGKWKCGELDAKDFGDEWNFLMDAETPTCRSVDQPYENADKDNFQYYMIDGFIVSKNLKVTSCETKDLGFANSDHNPVVLKVKLS